MKHGKKAIALALSSLLVFSSAAAISACGGGKGYALDSRICYDNLPDDGIDIPASATRIEFTDAVRSVAEYNANGAEAAGKVATLKGNTLTAVGKGYAVVTFESGKTQRVEVVPAYVTNPDNEYSETGADQASGSALLGGTHDPSFIEVEENGKPVYYLFSTGWALGNEIRRSEDLIHWQLMGKATSATTSIPKIVEWIGEPNQATPDEAGGSIQWWAPDIVPAAQGGYWLYTCCVSNTSNHLAAGNANCSMACIVLFHSDSLAAGSFEYVGVLMQSAIPGSEGPNSNNVNSIDPQIIYTPEGKMYMAYGSFGTGNWLLELDPVTGLRKDGLYADGNFLPAETVRQHTKDLVSGSYRDMFLLNGTYESDYYGTMISSGAMEAPVIARHDNVTVSDENGKTIAEGKTFYYTMHSYNGLAEHYQLWGGRSESVTGTYRSALGTEESGAIVSNTGVGSGSNGGNKYMGRFTWANKTSNNIDIILPGHNDLFTNSLGTNLAAYITRSLSFGTQSGGGYSGGFVSQVHQYYLNSMGDIVINPNRYGGEANRAVSEEELFAYTDGGKFKMVALANDDDTKISVDVELTEKGKVLYEGDEVGTWKMYGAGYIYFNFSKPELIPMLDDNGESIFYGVVRPAWLEDQNRSGFTISCMGRTLDKNDESTTSYAMFMNNYSTMSGAGLTVYKR